MRATDRKRIQRNIESWKPMLGLSEWVITVSDDEPDEGLLGQCDFKRDLRVARIRLRSSVLTVPALENLTLLHELLHITEGFNRWYEQLEANALLEREQHHVMETLLDDVARWILVASGAQFPVPSVA